MVLKIKIICTKLGIMFNMSALKEILIIIISPRSNVHVMYCSHVATVNIIVFCVS